MTTTEFLATVISLSVFMLGTVLALVWYIGGRVDRLEDRLLRRLDTMDDHVQVLREDVAVIKATRD